MANLFDNFDNLENGLLQQAKTDEAKNLIRKTILSSKKKKLSTRETFTQINLLIVGSLGIC